MEISEKEVYFKTFDAHFPRVQCVGTSHSCSADKVVRLTDTNIFAACKCNISIYTERGAAYYVDVHVLNKTDRKEDLVLSFLRTERILDKEYGTPVVKKGKFFWKLFRSMSSKRKINKAIIEHHLYEHFGFRESITVRL